jgi:hypothetical protein
MGRHLLTPWFVGRSPSTPHPALATRSARGYPVVMSLAPGPGVPRLRAQSGGPSGAQPRGIDWRRELPPVVVVAGLAADYLSPSALWTVLLPLAAVVALIAMRRWAAAALVVVLSSWFLIPASARAVRAFDSSRGVERVFAVETAGIPGLPPAVYERCFADRFRVDVMRAGPGFVIEPNRYLKRVFWSFAELHNVIAIEDVLRGGSHQCHEPRDRGDTALEVR